MRSRILTLLISAALLAALPAAALATAGDVHRDCADNGALDKKHSASDLKKAKSSLPSDLDEYTDCRAAINKGLAATASTSSTSSNEGSDAGGSNGSGGSGSSGSSGAAGTTAAATPSSGDGDSSSSGKNGKSSNADGDNGSGSLAKPKAVVAGQTVEPGKNGLFKASNATNELPLPILLALIGVALLTAAGGFLVMKRRGIAPSAALRFLRR